MATADDDQDDTTAPSPPSALASLQSPSLKQDASDYADKYFKSQLSGENTRGEAALFQQQDADAEQVRQALRSAREKLAAQRLDPSVLGLRVSQALMAPSRMGGSQWSNAIGAVADWRQQNQEYQQKQDAQDLSLQQQLSGIDAQSLKSKLALEELRQRNAAQTADTALKIAAKPDPRAESPIGKMVEDRLGVGSLQTQAGQAMFDAFQKTQDAWHQKTGIANLPQPQQDAITQAIVEGRLDPARVNSRTAPIFAQIESQAPGTNYNRLTADAALQRNTGFQTKAMNLETLPDIIQQVGDAGKKLGYNDLKIVGGMQAWANGQNNDPDYTFYMTKRNDALMNIASLMRGQGMSDQAHKAEMEAASPTLSPRALDAWMRAQNDMIQPRLQRSEKVVHHGEPGNASTTSSSSSSAASTDAPKALTLDDYLKKQGY